MTIRVFIVDDHAIVRTGLRMILSAEVDIEVVGDADSGEAALPQIRSLKPDVVLSDLHLPGASGLDLTERLVRLRVSVPDSPGSLAKVTVVIGEAGGNVIDVEHQRAFSHRSIKQADVDFTIETRNAAHAEQIVSALALGGFVVDRLPS